MERMESPSSQPLPSADNVRSSLRRGIRRVMSLITFSTPPCQNSLKSRNTQLRARCRWLSAKVKSLPGVTRDGTLGDHIKNLGEKYSALHAQKQRELEELEFAGDAAFSVDSAANIDFRIQGDKSYYTKAALIERDALASDPRVASAAQAFWTLLCEAQMLDNNMLHCSSYERMFRLVHKVLIEDFEEEEVMRSVGSDWERESTNGALSEAHLQASLFELTDMWVDSTEAADYVNFLELLLHCISSGNPPNRSLLREDDVCCMVERFMVIGEAETEEEFRARYSRARSRTYSRGSTGSSSGNDDLEALDAAEHAGGGLLHPPENDGQINSDDHGLGSVQISAGVSEISDNRLIGVDNDVQGCVTTKLSSLNSSPSRAQSPSPLDASSSCTSHTSDRMPPWLVRQSSSLEQMSNNGSQSPIPSPQPSLLSSSSLWSMGSRGMCDPPWIIRQSSQLLERPHSTPPVRSGSSHIHASASKATETSLGPASRTAITRQLSDFRRIFSDERAQHGINRIPPVVVNSNAHTSFLEGLGAIPPKRSADQVLVPTKLNLHLSLRKYTEGGSSGGGSRSSPQLDRWLCANREGKHAGGNIANIRARTESRSAPVTAREKVDDIGAREVGLPKLNQSVRYGSPCALEEPLVIRSPMVRMRVKTTTSSSPANIVADAMRVVETTSRSFNVNRTALRTPKLNPKMKTPKAQRPTNTVTLREKFPHPPVSPLATSSVTLPRISRRTRKDSPSPVISPQHFFGTVLASRLRRPPTISDGAGPLQGALLCGTSFRPTRMVEGAIAGA